MVAAVKKGCSRGGQTLQVRFGEANVRRIVDFLISSIDIRRHRFILCPSEEELPQGTGKQGTGRFKVGKCCVAAVSERCRGDNVL
jgi:hypothetical protein